MNYLKCDVKVMIKKLFKSPIGFTLILIIAVILIQSVTGRSTLLLDLAGDEIRLLVGEEYALSIPYSAIDSIELLEMPKLEEKISGGETRSARYGVYRIEPWGECEVCVAEDCKLCLMICAQGKPYLINYESEETTENLANAIPELMANKGYELS